MQTIGSMELLLKCCLRWEIKMQSLEIICPEVLDIVRKSNLKTKRRIRSNMKGGGYPIDQNFNCPFCSYHNSSKIFSNTGFFVCFSCGEKRNVDHLKFKSLKGGIQ